MQDLKIQDFFKTQKNVVKSAVQNGSKLCSAIMKQLILHLRYQKFIEIYLSAKIGLLGTLDET
jgi:hypothetical protein